MEIAVKLHKAVAKCKRWHIDDALPMIKHAITHVVATPGWAAMGRIPDGIIHMLARAFLSEPTMVSD